MVVKNHQAEYPKVPSSSNSSREDTVLKATANAVWPIGYVGCDTVIGCENKVLSLSSSISGRLEITTDALT